MQEGQTSEYKQQLLPLPGLYVKEWVPDRKCLTSLKKCIPQRTKDKCKYWAPDKLCPYHMLNTNTGEQVKVETPVSQIFDEKRNEQRLQQLIKIRPSDGVKVVYVTKALPQFNEALIYKFNPEIHKFNAATEDFWYVGYPDILKFCDKYFHINNQDSIREWTKIYAFPLRKFPNKTPFLIVIEAVQWAITYSNMVKKELEEMKNEMAGELKDRYGFVITRGH